MEWRETGFGRKNRNRGGPEAIGHPPLYLPPMNVHLGKEALGGYKQVGPVRENGKNQTISKAMIQMGGDTPTSRRETTDGAERSLRQC